MAAFVKICPRCGHHNPDTVNSCQSCPASLGGVQAVDPDAPEKPPEPPARDKGAPSADSLRLELAKDPSRAVVVREGQTVGTAGHADSPDVILEGVPETEQDYISGRHIQVLRNGPDWFVKHVGRTNYIVVDGSKYQDDAEVPVHDGSSLFLTYTELIVRCGNGAA